jgi:hypothetical protein
MFDEMDKIVGEFNSAILSAVEPTQAMIDVVSKEWEKQYKEDHGVFLDPESCKGMTQFQIDKTVEWLHKNS